MIVDSIKLCRENFADIESVSASASVKDGVLTLTLANLDLTEEKTLQIGSIGGSIRGEGTLSVLSAADPNACNTFENPQAIVPVETAIQAEPDMQISLPPAGIAALTIKLA